MHFNSYQPRNKIHMDRYPNQQSTMHKKIIKIKKDTYNSFYLVCFIHIIIFTRRWVTTQMQINYYITKIKQLTIPYYSFRTAVRSAPSLNMPCVFHILIHTYTLTHAYDLR